MRRPPLSITIVLLAIALLSTACRSSGSRSIRLDPPQPGTGPTVLDAASLEALDLQEVPVPTVDDEGWRVMLAPYGWLLGINGDVTVGGMEAEVDQDFGDILDSLNWVVEGRAEFWKGRWGYTLDLTYSQIGEDAEVGPIDVDITTEVGLIGAGINYRFVDQPVSAGDDRRLRMDGLVGVLWTIVDNEIDFSGGIPDVDKSEDWVDLTFGGRITRDFTEQYTGRVLGLIGGFGIGDSSDLIWGLEGALGRRFGKKGNKYFWFGYRVLSIDYEKNSDFALDALIHGPVVGVNFLL